MTKEDLKTGDVLFTRCGDCMIYFEEYIGRKGVLCGVFGEFSRDISKFDNKFRYKLGHKIGTDRHDITEIYRPESISNFPRDKIYIKRNYYCIYNLRFGRI